MRLHRFYITKPLGEEIVSVDDLALIHQLTSVFRYKDNDEVILFSGDGYDYHYSILSSSKKEISFKLINKRESIAIDKNITLYMSLVKKDTFEHIIRACTELGVTHFVPIIAERCEKKGLNEERLKIIAIEASEQCGRGDVPTISPIISIKDAVNSVSSNAQILVASLLGEKVTSDNIQNCLKKKDISIFIGPEGGWSEGEEKMFENKGFIRMKLTDTVLKADTGAQTALSTIILS